MATGQIIGADLQTEAGLAALPVPLGPEVLPATSQIFHNPTNQVLEVFLALGGAAAPAIVDSLASPQLVTTDIDLTAAAGRPYIIVFIQGVIVGDTPLLLSNIINSAPFAGQIVDIYGTSDAQTVSITDGHNGPITFGDKKIGTYLYNGVEFVEKGRN